MYTPFPSRPRLVVFASGTVEGGGSGFQNLVNASRSGILNANIVGVISNIKDGGVKTKASNLRIPFTYFRGPLTEDGYQDAIRELNPDFIALSGWLYLVKGLDPRTTFNIHPGPLSSPGDICHCGGKGMHGHHVHEKVMQLNQSGYLTESQVCMHFINSMYDAGPVFLRVPVPIELGDTPETLGTRVNKVEHIWQPIITNMVVHGLIHWDGKNPESITFPKGYDVNQVSSDPDGALWMKDSLVESL